MAHVYELHTRDAAGKEHRCFYADEGAAIVATKSSAVEAARASGLHEHPEGALHIAKWTKDRLVIQVQRAGFVATCQRHPVL